MILPTKNNRGFTLIELMIAMVIGLLIMASIYKVFSTYQRADASQRLVVDMLQNARSAMLLMEREIRMAGHAPAATDGQDNEDPADGNKDDEDSDSDYPGGFPQFLVARTDTVRFSMDFMPDAAWCKDGQDNDGDGSTDEQDECNSNGNTSDLNEDITYANDGTDLKRDDANDGKTAQVLAYDIEAIAFAYAYDADGDDAHNPDTDGDDNIIWAYDSDGNGDLDKDIAGGSLGTAVAITDSDGRSVIRAVKIWLLARTASPIRNYADTATYQVGDQTFTKDDYDPRYKRTLLTSTIYCRNTKF